jgi:hypothetical protein
MQEFVTDPLSPNIVFSELLSRLHALKTGNFNADDLFDPRPWMANIKSHVFKIPTSEIISLIDESLSRTKAIQDDIETLLTSLSIKQELDGEWPNFLTEEDVRDKIRQKILVELSTYLSELEQIKESVITLPNYSNDSILPDNSDGNKTGRKIPVNMTVKELGALFQLLQAEGLIEADLTDKALGTLLSQTFKTKQARGSEKNMINALSPSNVDGLENWNIHLPSMQGKIKKITKGK